MGLGHFLFPAYCPCCELVSRSLCAACRVEISSWIPSSCWRCGTSRPGSCFCKDLPSAVEYIDSLWTLEGPVAQMVEEAKYKGELWRLYQLKREVQSWFVNILARHLERGVVIPVPPDRGRLRGRGFHLPAILARWASAQGIFTLDLNRIMRKPGNRSQQAGQSISGRKSQGALFSVKPPVPASVLLIDDVITTGATVTSCAQALAQGGAQQIRVISLGRTPWFGDSDGSAVSSEPGMAVDSSPSQSPGA